VKEMESNNSLIKSNRFSHLIELNQDKKEFIPIFNKISIGVNCKVPQLFKPKIIKFNLKNNEKSNLVILPNKRPFTNQRLKLIFKNEIPIISNPQIKNKNIKFVQSKRKNVYRGNLNWIIKSLSFRNLEEDKDIFKDETKENFLPKIFKVNKSFSKSKSISRNNKNAIRLNIFKSESEKNLKITSGMLNSKRLYNNRDNKFSLHSFMISSPRNNSLTDEEEDNKSFFNKHRDFNSRNVMNNKKKANKHFLQRYTKTGLLNKLYQKYSRVNYSINRGNFSENLNVNSTSDINNSQKNNTYLTRLKNDDISHISERYNNMLLNIKKNNTQIININKKIYINCLLSKVNEKLKKEKLFVDKNKKTIYELDKESSYRRVKRFEDFINKLYKEKA
jgi:hypothetical protein